MCNKEWYTTEKQAKTMMNFIRLHWKKRTQHIPKRCYKCPDCWLRHMTKEILYIKKR